jgi:DnaJ-class molecular chaperone
MNPRAVLGVAQDATPEQIKSAYRKLAMQHHPDQHGGSETATQKFQEIQAAYDMLRDDKPQSRQQQQQRDPFQGMHNPQDIHDMFAEMFRRQQQMNATYHAFSEITLQQAFEGCRVSFNLPNGANYDVDIPKGVNDNQSMIVQGAGGKENAQQPPGNLQVTIRVRPDPVFGRQGINLLCKVDVDILDAILGCDKEIKTFTGEKITIVVPPNSAPNTVITVKGEGMTILNSPNRGDLLVHLMVAFREFTPAQREILKQLKA